MIPGHEAGDVTSNQNAYFPLGPLPGFLADVGQHCFHFLADLNILEALCDGVHSIGLQDVSDSFIIEDWHFVDHFLLFNQSLGIHCLHTDGWGTQPDPVSSHSDI